MPVDTQDRSVAAIDLLCGAARNKGDRQLSVEAVDIARWLLQVVPISKHQALGDLVPQCAVVKWADARPVLYIEVIRDQWNISRATAYRWMHALGRANGVEVRLQ